MSALPSALLSYARTIRSGNAPAVAALGAEPATMALMSWAASTSPPAGSTSAGAAICAEE